MARVRRAAQGGARPARGFWRTWVCPALVCAVIVVQQRGYFLEPDRLHGAPVITETTTIHEPYLFDYGMYAWGLVPVYSLDLLDHRDDPVYQSPEAATRLLAERGYTLRMEYANAMRIGERMVKVMKYPLALYHRSAAGLSHRGILGTVYALGLCLLAFSLCRFAPFPLGVILPLVFSSSQFAACDIYLRSLTQTVLIDAAIFAMALLSPIIFDRRLRTGSLLLRGLLLTSVIVFLMNIRSTISPLYAGILLVMLCYRRRSLGWRLAMFVAILGCHVLVARLFDAWWGMKYREASAVVEQFGGQPFRGIRMTYHSVYHSVWCGLADFDHKYGYRWSDNQPESYAWPILQAQGQNVDLGADQMGYVCGGAYIEYQAGYGKVLEARLRDNIRADPGWYARIILQRVQRILFENEPARLNVPAIAFTVQLPRAERAITSVNLPPLALTGPRSPWPYLAVLALLLIFRLWGYVKLLLLAMPTLAVPLIITTYGGQQVEFVGHLVLAAIAVTVALRLAAWPVAALGRRCKRRAACAG